MVLETGFRPAQNVVGNINQSNSRHLHQSLRVISMGLCGWSPWVSVGGLHGSLWVVSVGGLCGWSLWVVSVGGLCGWSLWVVSVCSLHGWSLWVSAGGFHGSLQVVSCGSLWVSVGSLCRSLCVVSMGGLCR